MLNRVFVTAAFVAASLSVSYAFGQCNGGSPRAGRMGTMQISGLQSTGVANQYLMMQRIQQQYAAQQAQEAARQAARQRKRELIAKRAESNRQSLAERRARIREAIALHTQTAGSSDESSLAERFVAAAQRADSAGNERAALAYFALAKKYDN